MRKHLLGETASVDQPVCLPRNGIPAIGAASNHRARIALLLNSIGESRVLEGEPSLPMPSVVKRAPSCRWPNCLAILVLGGAVGFAYLNCDPMLAGSEPSRKLASLDVRPVLALPVLPQRQTPAPGEPSAPAETSAAAAPGDAVLRGKWAMAMSVALLERGLEKFQRVPSYTFTLTRQERVGADLLSPQVMNVKLRHEPLSLYIKWVAGEGTGVKGRQLLYVQGANDDKLLVLPGGIAGRLSGTVSLRLDDPLVTAEARHPATQCGLKHLAETLLGYQRKDLAAECHGVACELHDQQVYDDRPCYLFVSVYESPQRSPLYRKSVFYIDKELSLPTCIRNYTWGPEDVAPEALDELTLVEAYSYSEIVVQPEVQLADEDFSRSKYRMTR